MRVRRPLAAGQGAGGGGLRSRIRNLRQQKRAGTLDSAGMTRLQNLRAKKNGMGGGQKAFGDKRPLGQAKELLSGFYDNINSQMDQIGTSLNPLNFDSLPDSPSEQELSEQRAKMEGDLYSKFTTGFDEQKAKGLDSLEQRLADRGIMPGSGDAYKNEMDRFNKSWDDRFESARTASVQGGGQEMERTFGMGRLGRDDALKEQMLARQMPLQQIQGLMGLSNGIQGLLQNNKQFNKNQKFQKWATQYQGDLQSRLAEMQNQAAMNMAQFQLANRPGPQAPDLSPPPPPPGLE